jgi:hypothetical protein
VLVAPLELLRNVYEGLGLKIRLEDKLVVYVVELFRTGDALR